MTTFDIDRKAGIGASEAATVLGLNPHDTAAAVWARKLGELEEKPETLAMRLGTLLEPIVAQIYQEREGFPIRRRRRAYFDPSYPFLYAHVDRQTKDRIVEIKTSGRPSQQWGPDGSSDIPVEVMVQVLLQMRYAKRARADVVAMLWGRDIRTYPIDYDPELAESIVERLARWWIRYVVGREQPPVDGSDAAKEFLRHRYPADNGEEIIAMPTDQPLIDKLLAARAMAAAADAEKQDAENAVKDYMREASAFTWDGGQITWRRQSKTTTDWQRVAEWVASYLNAKRGVAGYPNPFWATEVTETPAQWLDRLPDDWYEQLVAGNTTTTIARYFRVNERKAIP